MESFYDKLIKEQEEASWTMLEGHHGRDVVVVVSAKLNLARVGEAMANDNSAKMKEWMRDGLVMKPTDDQVETWKSEPQKKFLMNIVDPFVVIQELGS